MKDSPLSTLALPPRVVNRLSIYHDDPLQPPTVEGNDVLSQGSSIHSSSGTVYNSSIPPSSLDGVGFANFGLSGSSLSSTLCNVLPLDEPVDLEASLPGSSLPLQRRHAVYNLLRFNWSSVYKRLFTLYLLANFAALLFYSFQIPQPTLVHVSSLSIPIAVNLLVAALTRTEMVVNALFTMVMLVPISAPLRVRRILAKVYEYGGFHSGAGTSVGLWLILFLVQVIKGYLQAEIGVFLLVVTNVLTLLCVIIIASAIPQFRARLHDCFEAFHRFSAWLSLCLFWTITSYLTLAISQQLHQSLAKVLLMNPSFYILLIITFFVILPWSRLRKVTARAERLSSHAMRMHFSHQNVSPSQTLKLSTNPLFEWHSFATIPNRDAKGFSILVSNAGDWTSRHIDSPLAKYWTKGVPTTGMARVIQLFHKVIIVATGSGIAPVLANLIHSQMAGNPVKCRLIWSTRDPQITYGTEILDEVHKADPQAMIINTQKHKARKSSQRPDLSALAYRAYRDFGAEAVIVISNPQLTHKIKFDMESRGIPAFSPIFDS